MGGEGWRPQPTAQSCVPRAGSAPSLRSCQSRRCPQCQSAGLSDHSASYSPLWCPRTLGFPTWEHFHIKLHILFAPRVDEGSAQSEASSFPEGLGGPAGISGGSRVTTHSGLTGRGA